MRGFLIKQENFSRKKKPLVLRGGYSVRLVNTVISFTIMLIFWVLGGLVEKKEGHDSPKVSSFDNSKQEDE